MKTNIFTVYFIAFMFLTGTVLQAQQAPISLDQAVDNAAQYLNSRFPKGTRAALIAVQGENKELGEFVYKKLSSALVNGGWFKMTERDAAALASIDKEMERHLNYQVSEETELSIGKQLGAQIIISSSFARSGQNWRLDIKAVKIETAEQAGVWGSDVRPDSAWTSLVTARTAGLIFTGDELNARDKQTVAAGLRSAMQVWNVKLELNENNAGTNGYFFTVNLYRTRYQATGLTKAEITVTFNQNNKVLFQTGPFDITEMDESRIPRLLSDRLRADQAFFKKVSEAGK